MESNNTMDQLSKEIHNHLMNVVSSMELGRSESQWRLAERKMETIENSLLTDPFVTDDQISSLVGFKRGPVWTEALNHLENLKTARMAA
ncbi:MAG: hypothetical protein K8R69_03755 [Deltaproteobacteria bacterium]|nr:hypothetical protein [Deltaproteobacteria bacterium]